MSESPEDVAAATLPDFFPDAHIVEFHRQGRGKGAFSNWSSIILVIEKPRASGSL